jgi:hypothetical protein
MLKSVIWMETNYYMLKPTMLVETKCVKLKLGALAMTNGINVSWSCW